MDRIVRAIEVPSGCLLDRYSRDDGFADAYCVEVEGEVSFERWVACFYTTWLFKLERAVLTLVGRPASDAQARELAAGTRTRFAAWTVEAREARQLLLADDTGRTRSWLMCEPMEGGKGTRLYFGSAVVPRLDSEGRRSLGPGFSLLLGFHKRYSRALLGAAVAQTNA